jgi:hypothetical protein
VVLLDLAMRLVTPPRLVVLAFQFERCLDLRSVWRSMLLFNADWVCLLKARSIALPLVR